MRGTCRTNRWETPSRVSSATRNRRGRHGMIITSVPPVKCRALGRVMAHEDYCVGCRERARGNSGKIREFRMRARNLFSVPFQDKGGLKMSECGGNSAPVCRHVEFVALEEGAPSELFPRQRGRERRRGKEGLASEDLANEDSVPAFDSIFRCYAHENEISGNWIIRENTLSRCEREKSSRMFEGTARVLFCWTRRRWNIYLYVSMLLEVWRTTKGERQKERERRVELDAMSEFFTEKLHYSARPSTEYSAGYYSFFTRSRVQTCSISAYAGGVRVWKSFPRIYFTWRK